MKTRLSPGLCALMLCCSLVAVQARAEIVQGFVKNESGAGLPGISVKFTGDTIGAQPSLVTDAIGSYSVNLSPDTYRVSFIPAAGSPLVAERLFDIVVVSAMTLPDVTLLEGVIVSGLVTNNVGSPVANTDLTFEDVATGNTVFTPNDNTDATGRYAIAVPTGIYDIEFTPPDFPPLVPRVLQSVSITSPVELAATVLNPGVVVNGTVRDELAAPVPGVRLDFYDPATGNKVFTTDDSTNEFGVFRVVVDPQVYEIRFLPPSGGRLLPRQLFDVSILADTTLSDTVLLEGFELTGRVLDGVGSPVAAVDLDVFVADTGERLLTPRDDTGADGRYRLVVPAGTFDLRYNPPAGSPFLRVTVNGVAISGDLERPDVVLPDGFVVSGRLVDETSAPVAGVDLDFIDLATGQALALTRDDSDSDGRFSITVPPGNYEIRFAPPQASNFVPFLLADESVVGDRDLGELQVASGWAVSGTVVDATTGGIAGVDVDILDGGQSVFIENDETDLDGFFRVVVLEGLYRVLLDPGAGSPFFPLLTGEINVQDNVDLGLVELSTGVTVDGIVRDQFDAPIVGVTVEFTGEDGSNPPVLQAETDAVGSFALLVGPGNYRVRYLPPSALYSDFDAGSVSIQSDTTLPPVVLTRVPLLTGRAVDEIGSGVPGVDVDVLDAVTGGSIPLQNDVTDIDGHFAVVVPDGTYLVRLDPPVESALFGATSPPVVVLGDTDVGNIVLPQAAQVSGSVTDDVGAPVQGVQVSVTEVLGGTPKSHLADTDRGGQYSFLVAPGDYLVSFDPPPNSQLFPVEIGPLTLAATVELATVALEPGWWVSGRVLDGAGTGLVGVDIDVLDEVTGASIPLQGDTSVADGAFAVLVRSGSYRVRVEPAPATRLLPLVTNVLDLGPNADAGDLILATGFLVEGDVSGDMGQPLEGVDLDLVDSTTGLDALLVDERTDVNGHLVTAAPPGQYFAEYKPPRSTRWIAARTGPHAVVADTVLPAVQLMSGFLVSGTVVDEFAAPLAGVETTWVVSGTCEVVFTVRKFTDRSGRFEIALPSGSYDLLLQPPLGSGLGARKIVAVTVVDQDVVLPTEMLVIGGAALEACNAIDDDCDGLIDEDYPGLTESCTSGLGACESTGLTVCSADGSTTVCDAVPGSPSAESCDGIDNDCDGVVDNGCVAEGFELFLDGDVIAWNQMIDAVDYDVIRGGLSELHVGGPGAAVEACLAEDTLGTQVIDGTQPSTGTGTWFLVRGNPAAGTGTWGSTERDVAIDAAPLACLP